jgi:predicted acylesterase/phospholipase RssA
MLQTLAGRDATAAPLTFGDLTAAGIELRMMTTNLTRRQPMDMPWAGEEYFFDPETFRELFPDSVVTWMEDHPPETTGTPTEKWISDLLRNQALPKRPLPAPEALPIVVATRMSLSFPFLVSAVPLHAVDYYTTTANTDAQTAARRWLKQHPDRTVDQALADLPRHTFDVNWFSDGGICSNLPLHFFDRSLPTRPTFAIDLARFTPRHPKSTHEPDNTYLPEMNRDGLLRRWTCWEPVGFRAVIGFAQSIVGSARSWVDESQLVMPGYRDRIVTIFLDGDEGGLNLTMPRPVVEALAARGRGGAAKLVQRFAGQEPGVVPAAGWDNQRWIRFRTATAGLQRWLADFRDGYRHHSPGGTPYAELAGPGATASLPSYALNEDHRAVVNQRTGELLSLIADWESTPADGFAHGAPSPQPQLRLSPGERAVKHKASPVPEQGLTRAP